MTVLATPERRLELDKKRSWDGVKGHLQGIFRDLHRGEKPWPLFLYGDTGRGKTCAALALADRVSSAGYWNALELCDKLRNPDYWAREAIWSAISNKDLAILDEIGKRDDPTPHQKETLLRFAERRGDRPTIYISNKPLPVLDGVYDAWLIGRWQAGYPMELKDKDRRREGK